MYAWIMDGSCTLSQFMHVHSRRVWDSDSLFVRLPDGSGVWVFILSHSREQFLKQLLACLLSVEEQLLAPLADTGDPYSKGLCYQK